MTRQRIFLVLFGIVIGVLMIEIMGRVLRLMPVPPPESFYDLREQVGVVPEPYQFLTYASPGEFNNFVQINYRSLRDIDHDYAPPANGRILFLGDSFTAGLQVPLQQTYVGQLRPLLTQDVINAGFNNWGTDQQYLFYKVEGHKYASDVVVLQIFAGNDVVNNGGLVLEAIPLADGRVMRPVTPASNRAYFDLNAVGTLRYQPPIEVVPSNFERVRGVRSFLTQYSFIYNLILRFQTQQKNTTPVLTPLFERPTSQVPIEWYGFNPDAEENTSWQQAQSVTFELIHALRTDVEADGAAFVVLLVDSHYEYAPGRWEAVADYFELPDSWQPRYAGDAFRDFLEAENIPYLSPLEAVLAYGAATDERMLYERDSHWTPAGQCVVAVELHNWLVANGYATSNAAPPLNALAYCPDHT